MVPFVNFKTTILFDLRGNWDTVHHVLRLLLSAFPPKKCTALTPKFTPSHFRCLAHSPNPSTNAIVRQAVFGDNRGER